MKRFFFTAIALAAVAISCTKSGVLETPHTYVEPISFEPYAGKATITKASIADDSTIEAGFRVLGFVDGTATEDNPSGLTTNSTYLRKVVRDTNSDSEEQNWEYNGTMYWPESGTLTFMAYGLNVNPDTSIGNDGDMASTSTIFTQNGSDYTSYNYKVKANASDHRDLLISAAKTQCNSSTDNGTINLRFYHVLSRVGFKVKNEATYTIKDNEGQDVQVQSSAKVTIKSVKLVGGFIENATYNLLTAVTESTSGTANYDIPDDDRVRFVYSLFGGDFVATSTSGSYPGYVTPGSESATYPIYNNTTFTQAATFVDPTSTTTTYQNDRYMMIVPGEVEDVVDTDDINDNNSTEDTVKPYIEVVYQITNGDQKTVILPLPDEDNGDNFTFLPGKAYEFVFTISTVSVGFDVTVGDWTVVSKEETINPNE